MTLSDESREPPVPLRFQWRRLVRLLVTAVGILLAYFAWLLLPPWLNLLWSHVPYTYQRKFTIGLLDGLLVIYVLALVAAALGLLVLGVALGRSGWEALRRRSLGRLTLFCFSMAMSLAMLELGSAAWYRWLHRTPTAPAKAAGPNVSPGLPTAFQPAPDGAVSQPLRFLVIGESSGRGEPYHPWLSVGQIAAWQLERVFPGRKIEVEIWATGGAILETMHQKLATLTYRPDALIVFSGHNEYYGRWAWSRNVPYYDDEREHKPEATLLDLVLRNSPFCRLILETIDRQRVSLIPRKVVTRALVDRPTYTEKEQDDLESDYRRRVEAIADFCQAMGTLPIFIIPGSNDGDYEPSRSVMPPSTTPAERDAFAREFLRVRTMEADEPARAVEAYRELLGRAPGFAEAHYRLGRLLASAGAWDEARGHYVKAREFDGMPIRCPEALREIYRSLGARRPEVIVIDSTRVFEPMSPHGILDDHLYHDAQHPTLRGYIALAQDLLRQLHERRAFNWPQSTPVPTIDPDECARHFQLDRKRWAEVCTRSKAFFDLTAYIRYDPEGRRARSDAYQRAGEQILAGNPPEKTGITGLGVHPEEMP
jgi:hypothetical protein